MGGGLSGADILQTRGKGAHQMRMSALFDAKNFGFFEVYDVFVRTRRGGRMGLSECRQFADNREESILCGRPLWTAPYLIILFIKTSNIKISR